MHVTLYRTWRPSDLSTGLHGQVHMMSLVKEIVMHTDVLSLINSKQLLQDILRNVYYFVCSDICICWMDAMREKCYQ